MKTRQAIVLVSVACLIVILVLASLGLESARHFNRRTTCRNQLRAITFVIRLFAEDHQGAFPHSLSGLAPTYVNDPELFRCSDTLTTLGSMTNVDQWMDYIYIHWDQGIRTPTNFPLMFDRRVSNHQWKGINIVRVDGSVLWDVRGQWLRAFANEHPDLRLPLPEGM